jgi:hypothetical protein
MLWKASVPESRKNLNGLGLKNSRSQIKIINKYLCPILLHDRNSILKFMYSEKATKFCEISTNYLTGSKAFKIVSS